MPKHNQFILESRIRCENFGLDPDSLPTFSTVIAESDLISLQNEYKALLSVIDFFSQKLLHLMNGVPVLLIISDRNGCILKMAGDEAIKAIVLESGIKVGLVFTENEAGTNSITLALMHHQPVQLVGTEHYFRFLHSSVCYSVPFQGPDCEEVLGTVTIMTAVEQHNPFLLAMLSTVVDSIERELLLKKQNMRLHLLNQIVIKRIQNGIVVTDKTGVITESNSLAEMWINAENNRFFGETINNEKIIQCIQDVLTSGMEYLDVELQIYQPFSEASTCLVDAYPVYDEHGHVSGAVVQFRDVTERYKKQREIDYLAYHDDLTGLYNRRHFVKSVNKTITDIEFGKFAIILLDLDRFKRINDNLGHHHGDALLNMVAERLQRFISSTDILARMGGDEFTILIKNVTDKKQIASMADKLVSAFERPFFINNYEFYMTASIGIAIYPEDGLSLEKLMRHVDTAMYRAKDFGKNQYMFFQVDQNNEDIDQILLENSLQNAFKNEQFTIEYQPQINTMSQQIVGMEALIRWIHPTKGIIYPAEFIPLAEETGMIEQIGEWVLRNACIQLAHWLSSGLSPIRISVNLSLRQFMQPNLVTTVKNILEETALDPNCLELEITETMTMDVAYTVEILKQLKNLGVHISIDDFGTGYSNLFYLKMFSIDQLKIDQSFVQNVTTNKNDADIVSTIIAMARNLNLDVTAEGVETREQMLFLQIKGCYKVQGYFYSKALPADQAELALRNPELFLSGR